MRDRLAALLLAGALAGAAAPVVAADPPSPLQDTLDPSVAPGDDFYRYANGGWLTAEPPPQGLGRTDSTTLLRAQNARQVRALVDAAAAQAPSLPPQDIRRKVGDYALARRDLATVEARGLAPLAPELAAIAAIRTRSDLAAALGRLTRLDDGGNTDTESLWGLWVHVGFHDPDRAAAHLLQGGLGLPDEDFLSPEGGHRRTLYRDHVAALFRAAGFDDVATRAERVLALETAIARTHASRADTDDVFKTDNTWRHADFAVRAPGVDWPRFFAAAQLEAAPSFVVWQPGAVTGGARLVAEQPLAAWRDDLAVHLIAHYAAVLPRAFADEQARFAAETSGAAPADPVAATEAVLGEAIAELYVRDRFPPAARQAATAMAEDLRSAFRRRLADAAWMSPQTREIALAKLSALQLGVGHPPRWVDYGELEVRRDDALGNLRRAEAFRYRRAVRQLARPIAPDAWPGALQGYQVGAILELSPNAMQFAAGLLQPPYFDPAGDLASNYGSAGAAMAHEISHSFDDVGRLYDAHGNLAPWQSEAEIAARQAALAPLAKQLADCCPAPDLCAHPDQVLSESAADLLGLMVAHDAYRLALKGAPDAVKGGLTGEQRFFIAFAQRWRRRQGEESLRHEVAVDSHAPAACRAALVRNLDAWHAAFAVTPGQRLYLPPDQRVRLW